MTERFLWRWRWRGRVAAGAAFVASAVAGAAWGCVPQPLVSVSPHASGEAGSEVTVDAVSVPGAAEVRWNSIDGPLLAKATGPTFSVPIKIPQVPHGLYGLIVVGRGADASVAATGRAAFLVTSPGAAAPRQPSAPEVSRPSRKAGSSDGASPVLVGAGGAGLVLLGGLAGASFSGRRRKAAPSSGAQATPADDG